MRQKSLLALEIGSTKVTCLLGQPTASSTAWFSGVAPAYDLAGAGLAAYETPARPAGGDEPGWPSDPAILASAISRALDDPSLAHRPDRAVVALSHPTLAHRVVRARIDLADQPITIRSRDLQRLKAQAIGQALGVDREALLCEPLGYDGNGFAGVSDPRGLPTTSLGATFQLVTVPLAVRRAVLQALDMAGLELDRVVYTVQALAAALLVSDPTRPEERSSARMLLVDIGGACTDLALVDRGTLVRTHTIAWGGQHLVAAVASAHRLTAAHALAATLEGLASSKPDVRALVEAQLAALQAGLHDILNGVALPERAVVTGRGALIDGLVEWIERTTALPSLLGRSPRTQPLGDLARQVAFSPLVGLLAVAFGPSSSPQVARPSRAMDRLLDRTKRLLIDYF